MAEDEKKYKSSRMKEIFTTNTTNITLCRNCDSDLYSREATMLIKVEFFWKRPQSLQQCIKDFSKEFDVEKFPCKKCDSL